MTDDVRLHADLLGEGRTHRELAQLVRQGTLVRLRRGAYADPPPGEAEATQTYRTLLEAAVHQLSPESVLSHVSAAVVHGLPTWPDQLDRVHITRDRAGGGKRRTGLQVHGVPIGTDEIATVDGLRVTGLARTVLDLACALSFDRGVAVGDAALRIGLRDGDLEDLILAAGPRHGIGRARAVAGFVDQRSESPYESISRVQLWRCGIPTPDLQYVVRDAIGRFVARCDFGWPELGTVGEFDGMTKYLALRKPGQSLQRVILKEKRREERMRELGWQVVRWQASDLTARSDLAARLEAAFRRGRPMAA